MESRRQDGVNLNYSIKVVNPARLEEGKFPDPHLEITFREKRPSKLTQLLSRAKG